MTTETRENQRSRLGYGSSYRKGTGTELGEAAAIGTVLGGQVWMVTPDKRAEPANPCLWMQAGVVEFKNCNNFYDCTTCKYDLGMTRKVESGKALSWQDAMRRKPDLERVCRHSLTNRIARRACAYDYVCSTCDFDQFFEDVWTAKHAGRPTEIHHVRGFAVPSGYYFHDGHAWAQMESGGDIRVGLDDFLLKLLGKADAFELPLIGKELDHGRAGWGLKRDGNEADVLSPVDGVIVEVNAKVRENPEWANRGPYEEGWLFMVRTREVKGAVKGLMTGADSLEWLKTEVETLESMVEEVAGPLAADGGYLQPDIYGHLPELGWGNLRHTFLKT